MINTTESNKRIAKNTLLLYFRMLFTLSISLYTSRVILNTLGVEDFGIYNVVAGVIVMLSFITGSLGGASSRYITYALGQNDMNIMKKTFRNILSIHLILAFMIFVIGETIGLWFVTTQLQIPDSRENAALWVYQFSIFASICSAISIPYNASIIAHEKMSAFAYISISDAILKLFIVFALYFIPYDKLIVYGCLYFAIQLFDQIIYYCYCKKHFEETKVKAGFDQKLFKEIFAFAGWTMNGNLAFIGFTQGLNILLNMFFGATVNAARGIAVQVQTAAQNFCTNFQMALNPQLTKSYAAGEYSHVHELLIASSKISFYLMLFISMPIMLEANTILHWWLGIVPEHTITFLRLILCTSLLFTLSNPILVSVHATGKIKKFQLIEGSMLLLIVPIAYIGLKYFHFPPEYVFMVHIVIELCTQYARIRIVLPMIFMPTKDYIKNVIHPILKVSIISPIIPLIAYNYLDEGTFSFFVVCTTTTCSILLTAYFIGCSSIERIFIKNKLLIILHLKNKKL